MKAWLPLTFNIILVTVAHGADCDCEHFPITPQACVQACRVAFVKRASKADLQGELKLDAATADSILRFRANQKFQSLDALTGILSPDKVSGIKLNFDQVSNTKARALALRYDFSHATTNGAESI